MRATRTPKGEEEMGEDKSCLKKQFGEDASAEYLYPCGSFEEQLGVEWPWD